MHSGRRVRRLLPNVFARTALIALCSLASMTLPARADDAAMIVGIVTNTDRQPVAHATVTASNGSVTRTTQSGLDGVYSFTGLEPGTWSVSSEAAGYRAVPPLQVATGGTTRYDIVLVTAPGQAPAAPAPSPAPSPSPAAASPSVPEALQSPEPGPENDTVTPFANDGYIGWMNGNTRENAPIFDTKFFTPEIRFDVNYLSDFNHPKDHTIVGSTEEFRSGEFQIEQVSFGGNFHWDNVQARFLSMFGMFARPRRATTPAMGSASGTCRTPTSISPRPTPAITSTSITASTSTRASSSPTSDCSATTTSTTGPTSLRSSRPIRPGSSTACASSGCRRRT